MKKRLVSLLLAFSMMLTFLPVGAVSAFAANTPPEHDFEVGTLYYKINEGDENSVTLVGISERNPTSVEIPATVTNPKDEKSYTVTAIGDGALYNHRSLTTVTFADDSELKTIGTDGARSGGAFGNTALTSIEIPASVTKIGGAVFMYCDKLETVIFKGNNLTSIGNLAFSDDEALTSITIPASVETIGDRTFNECKKLEKVTISENSHLAVINRWAFFDCPKLSAIENLENVKEIEEFAFVDCESLTEIKLSKNLEKLAWSAFVDSDAESLKVYYDGTKSDLKKVKNLYGKDPAKYLVKSFSPETYYPIIYKCIITFESDDGTVLDKQQQSSDKTFAEVTKPAADPSKAGFTFKGWKLKDSDPVQMFEDMDKTALLTDDMTFVPMWEENPTPPASTNYQLTVTGGTFTVKKEDADVTGTLKVTTDETTGKQTCSVPDGAEVTVTLDKSAIPEGMVFDLWSTGKFDLPLGQDYKAETITFTMSSDVDVTAQYRDASIDDGGSDIIGSVIIGGTIAAGGAVLGYQAYQLGAGFLGDLWGLPYFPSNRSALAMMLWEDAGKPMPESDILYPDVGWLERDMDLQHAARWAMEHELIPDKNDKDADLPPEEVKFFPDDPVSKYNVLKAWKKAQDLKKNS